MPGKEVFFEEVYHTVQELFGKCNQSTVNGFLRVFQFNAVDWSIGADSSSVSGSQFICEECWKWFNGFIVIISCSSRAENRL